MNLKKLSDRQLLDDYFKGDESAISTLISRHRKRVSDYIYMMVRDRNTADDIFQETFIKIVRFLREGRYIESGKFLSWALRIAHNQVIDHFRHSKQQNKFTESEIGYDILNSNKFSEDNFEDKLVLDQIQEDVRMLVNLLPEEQSEVVMLRYFNGLSFKEIAEQTGVSINTALGRMRYALINLRKLIQEKQLVLH